MSRRWTEQEAKRWHDAEPWRVGCNFIPSNAINQLEMWQQESFDPETIGRELQWARDAGMNSVRVYLHDLAYAQEPEAFLERIDHFLQQAAALSIKPLFVIFDDCWRPDPAVGPQPAPAPGRHNSGWLQSPGRHAALDPAQRPRLRQYVSALAKRFGDDDRILLWDIYNEVGNSFLDVMSWPPLMKWPVLALKYLSFRGRLPPTLALLEEAFGWMREAGVKQPLTAGAYLSHPRLNRRLFELSDVISFHNYKGPDHLRRQIVALKKLNRPLYCTEYMARTAGSTISACLPVFYEQRVSCFQWGLVAGKTQTIYSWTNRKASPPALWFHDLLKADGSPYDPQEVELLRTLSERARQGSS